MANREKATKEILKYIEKILPGENKKLYEELLSKMSDKDFAEYMAKLESGEETLFLVAPNLSEAKISINNNIKIAEELGHNFFERLRLTDPMTRVTYLTPVPYLVIDLPLRRQAQVLVKKISIPEDNSHVDERTAQPTGESKGSKLSLPEIQVLYAQGLDKTLEELLKFRGGDETGFRAMNKELIDKGSVSLAGLPSSGKVKSIETLSIFLKSMHINNNL